MVRPPNTLGRDFTCKTPQHLEFRTHSEASRTGGEDDDQKSGAEGSALNSSARQSRPWIGEQSMLRRIADHDLIGRGGNSGGRVVDAHASRRGAVRRA